MTLARALARDGDFAGARSILGEVMARPSFPDSRDDALAIMRQVVAAEAGKKKGQRPTDAWAAGQAGRLRNMVSETQVMMTFRRFRLASSASKAFSNGSIASPSMLSSPSELPIEWGIFRLPRSTRWS